MRKTIRVRAGDGLRLPLVPGLAIDSGLRVLAGDDVVEVFADDRFVRRCLRTGDLVLAEEKPTKAKKDKE